MNKFLTVIICFFSFLVPSNSYADPGDGSEHSFMPIFYSLARANFCDKPSVYNTSDSEQYLNNSDEWSCNFFKGFFSNVNDDKVNLFSVLMMSISYFIYYVAYLFFIYLILKIATNTATTGSFLTSTEDYTFFVRFLFGLFLLLPSPNYNYLIIHKVTYSIINVAASVSTQVHYSFNNAKTGWAKGLYDKSLTINSTQFSYFSTDGSYGTASFNSWRDSAKATEEDASNYITEYLNIVTGFIPLFGWGELGLPKNSKLAKAGSVVDMVYGKLQELFMMFFSLASWLPILIYAVGIPLIAVLTFLSIYLAWLYACFELMLLAPVICLGLMWPFIGGESFLGKTSNVIYLFLWVIFAPAMVIISYEVVFILLTYIFTIFSYFDQFKEVMVNLHNYITVPKFPSFTFHLEQTTTFLFYTVIIYEIVKRCFLFVRLIMNSFLNYIGDNSGVNFDSFAVGDKLGDMVSTLASKMQKPATASPGMGGMGGKEKKKQEGNDGKKKDDSAE